MEALLATALVLWLSGTPALAEQDSLPEPLELDESRTLYEQEVKSDLGYSMSQQTLAWLPEQRVADRQVLAWAGLNGLQGQPVWPFAGVSADETD